MRPIARDRNSIDSVVTHGRWLAGSWRARGRVCFNFGMKPLRRQQTLIGLFSVFAALMLGACGSDGAEGPPAQEVVDTLGRSCTLATAGDVTCDQAPMPTDSCESGATACFQLGTTGDASGPAAICAACCMGTVSHSAAGDCENLVCSTNDDCPPTYSRCLDGVCRY